MKIRNLNFIKIFFIAIKNYSTVINNGFILLISLIQTTILTKILNQSDYGLYGYFVSTTQLLYVITNWGLLSWGVDKISKINSEGNIIMNVIVNSRALSGLITLFGIIIFYRFQKTNYDTLVILSFVIYYLSLVFSVDIFYISYGNIKKLTIVTFFAKAVYFLIFLFSLIYIKSPNLFFLLFSIQNLITSIFYYLFNENKIKLYFLNFTNSIKILKESTPNFTIVLFSFFFASGPTLIAGSYLIKSEFSLVYASTAIIKMLQIAYNPMIQKILPKLNRLEIGKRGSILKKIKLDLFLAIFYSIFCIVFLWVFAPIIVKLLFNKNYIGLTFAIKLFSFSILPGILSTIIMSQIVVYQNLFKQASLLILILTIIIFFNLIYYSNSLTAIYVLKIMIYGEYSLCILLIILCKYLNKFSYEKLY
jgi:O-antigen/teichoic acid export membrane protein